MPTTMMASRQRSEAAEAALVAAQQEAYASHPARAAAYSASYAGQLRALDAAYSAQAAMSFQHLASLPEQRWQLALLLELSLPLQVG